MTGPARLLPSPCRTRIGAGSRRTTGRRHPELTDAQLSGGATAVPFSPLALEHGIDQPLLVKGVCDGTPYVDVAEWVVEGSRA